LLISHQRLMNGKVAIISGGVSDIGKTIGELFAGKGARLTSGRPPQSGQTAQAFDLGSAILFRSAASPYRKR
jgi:NAD(P)-dependent dehydrogenase (short-subunit alcohol dehydrogenase family)